MVLSQKELIEALEPLVDTATAGDVLLALGLLCHEKAEHLRCSWQDEKTAKRWDTLARRTMKLGSETDL